MRTLVLRLENKESKIIVDFQQLEKLIFQFSYKKLKKYINQIDPILGLEMMSIRKLRELAKDMLITNYSRMTKLELAKEITRIRNVITNLKTTSK